MGKIDTEKTDSKEIQVLVDERKYGEALSRLKEILKKGSTNGHLNFLLAFCLVESIMDPHKALYHYNLALKYGFNEFLVLKERGSLYHRLGYFEHAIADFRNALFLYPFDEELRQSLQRLTCAVPIDNWQRTTLQTPVIVSTVPKSGTGLLKNILLSIFGDRLLVRYLATNEYLQSLPELTNHIYLGHIWYSDELAARVSSVPKIILIRDPRDNIVSHAHFLNRNTEQYWTINQYENYWNNKSWDEKISSVIFGMSTPHNYPPSILNAYLNYALKWVGPNTLVIRYEDIIGSKFGGSDEKVVKTINSVIEFMGIKNVDIDVMAKKICVGADPAKSNTFRSGKVGKWVEEFRPSHVRQMKVAARGLVSSLGYERDEKWDIYHQKISKKNLAEPETPYSIFSRPLPSIDNQSIIEFARRRKNLDWIDYVQLRESFTESSQLANIIDEWALNLFIETDQLQDALHILEHFLQMSQNNPRWNYYYAFSIHRLKRDPHKALHHYNLALQYGFDEFWIRYNRGILFKELGDLESARVDLQQALTLNPRYDITQKILHNIDETANSKQLHLALSQAQGLVSNSEYERASFKLEEILNNFPNDAEANYLYGFCLHVLKRDLNKALSHYSIALEKGFDEFWTKYNRGILLLTLGNKDAALADLNCALKLKPDHSGPELVLRQLKIT